jgi:hypothetical protein
MLLLTEDAILTCQHVMGKVQIFPSQSFCTIGGRRVLVATDPESKSIAGCPNVNPAIGLRPCVTTLAVKQGYSDFVRIGGHRVCLRDVEGLTDGTPPGLVKYTVQTPGQALVNAR